MKYIKIYLPHSIALFGALIFLDSLRYKFTNHPNTETIFNKLNNWAASFGAEGLFSHWGLFGPYVIGSVELLAAIFLIVGISTFFRRLQAVGALIASVVMTGAVFFHLFTPLGIDPNNDGGGLFLAAVLLWIGSVLLVLIRKNDLTTLYKAKLNWLLKK